MITPSGPLAATQALTYHDDEYSRGDYYAEGGQVVGEWFGESAEALGLEGKVTRDDFAAVLHGEHPDGSGRRIRAKAPERYRIDQKTGEAVRMRDRAAHDFTFSPDKSWSVAIGVYADERLLDVMREANRRGLEEAQRHAAAYSRGGTETTGTLAVAVFEHDMSRAGEPHQHFHNVIVNLTTLPDGTTRALAERDLYRLTRHWSAVAEAELARGARELGYQVADNGKGSCVLVGVPRDLCDALSSRRQAIAKELEAEGLGSSAAGRPGQLAQKATRERKQHLDRAEQRQDWRQRAEALGVDVGHLPAETRPVDRQAAAAEALSWAMEHLGERQASYTQAQLEVAALRHGMSAGIGVDDLRAAMRVETQLVAAGGGPAPALARVMTSSAALGTERAVVARMREGLGAGEAIAERFEPGGKLSLSPGQLDVGRHIVTSRDQVIAVEGLAGAGKTTVLGPAVEQAKAAGWTVRGFASGSSQAKTLGEAGVDTKTLAALYVEREDAAAGTKQLWLVDEAGQMSSADARKLLDLAHDRGAKVVLVGDRLQHAAVGAGMPFAYLQKAGLRSVRLDEIQRQRRPAQDLRAATEAARAGDWSKAVAALEAHEAKRAEGRARDIPELRQALDHARTGHHAEARQVLDARLARADALIGAAELASRGRAVDAIRSLDSIGAVRELRSGLVATVATDYMVATQAGHSCLMTARTNVEREALNRAVRELRIDAGEVGRHSYKTTTRVKAHLTAAERREAASYQRGDYVRAVRDSRALRLAKGDGGRIVHVDTNTNRLTVELEGGRRISYDPAKSACCEAYHVREHRFAPGDRIQYREVTTARTEGAHPRDIKLANGALGTIRALDLETGRASVELEGGRRVSLDLARTQAVDYAYASTSHSAQGRTVDVVLAVDPGDQTSAYVDLTRAALEARVYTADKSALYQHAARAQEKTSALEAVGELGQRTPDTYRTQEADHATRTTGGLDLELRDAPALPADLRERLAGRGPSRTADASEHGSERAGSLDQGGGREGERAPERGASVGEAAQRDDRGAEAADRGPREDAARPATGRDAADVEHRVDSGRAASELRPRDSERAAGDGRSDGRGPADRESRPVADLARGDRAPERDGARLVDRDAARDAPAPGVHDSPSRSERSEPTAAPSETPKPVENQLAADLGRIDLDRLNEDLRASDHRPDPAQQRIDTARERVDTHNAATQRTVLEMRASGERDRNVARYIHEREREREPLDRELSEAKQDARQDLDQGPIRERQERIRDLDQRIDHAGSRTEARPLEKERAQLRDEIRDLRDNVTTRDGQRENFDHLRDAAGRENVAAARSAEAQDRGRTPTTQETWSRYERDQPERAQQARETVRGRDHERDTSRDR